MPTEMSDQEAQREQGSEGSRALGQRWDGEGEGDPRDQGHCVEQTRELLLQSRSHCLPDVILGVSDNLSVPQLSHIKTPKKTKTRKKVYYSTSQHAVCETQAVCICKVAGRHREWALLLSKH